jgi:hypothetical protein
MRKTIRLNPAKKNRTNNHRSRLRRRRARTRGKRRFFSSLRPAAPKAEDNPFHAYYLLPVAGSCIHRAQSANALWARVYLLFSRRRRRPAVHTSLLFAPAPSLSPGKNREKHQAGDDQPRQDPGYY